MNIDRKPFLFGIIAGIIIGAMITLPIAMSQGAKIGWSAAEQSTIGLGFELSYAEERARIAEAELVGVRAELEANRMTIEAWTGLASFYADAHQGRLTASGARFDMNAYTSAHMTLPFGTGVLVLDMERHTWTYTTITDRGPAEWTGREIDLSLAGARQLDMEKRGVARVMLMTMGMRPSTED